MELEDDKPSDGNDRETEPGDDDEIEENNEDKIAIERRGDEVVRPQNYSI